VSKGRKQVVVPNFSGMDLFNAKVLAERQGLIIKHISYTKKDVAYNKVITTDPAPGTVLYNTNIVSFLVSLPEDGDLIIMPELLGVDLWEARKTLSNYRLILGEIEYIDDVDLESNIVIDASVQSGERIKPGTVINLTISR
jgi:serine/threonine-protein kinase